jgi:hypothetical protein
LLKKKRKIRRPHCISLDAMMNEALGATNCTMLLERFGEELNGTGPEDVTGNAFVCFDEVTWPRSGGLPESAAAKDRSVDR